MLCRDSYIKHDLPTGSAKMCLPSKQLPYSRQTIAWLPFNMRTETLLRAALLVGTASAHTIMYNLIVDGTEYRMALPSALFLVCVRF